jgi:alpha-tubulin suppressor-like RCC1 family protein
MPNLLTSRRAAAAWLGAVLLSLAACDGGGGGPPTPPEPAVVASVEVAAPGPQVAAGTSVQLIATPRDAQGAAIAGRAVTWASSAEGVATVAAGGRVTAVAPGTAAIRATADGKTGEVVLTVIPTPVDRVVITPATALVPAGGFTDLQVETRDAYGNALAGRQVTLSTSDASVAALQGTRVNAVAAGTATITATAEGKTATAQITVMPTPVSAVAILPQTRTLEVGGSLDLQVIARDAAGNELPGRTATLTTSNPAVATVAGGRLTGVSLGTVNVTATVEGIHAIATFTVTPVRVAQVAILPETRTLESGTFLTLQVVARDSAGNELAGRPVELTTSDPNVIALLGSRVTAVTPGTALVTATVEGVAATAEFTVVPAPVGTLEIIPAGGTMRVGETRQVSVVAYDVRGRLLPPGRVVVVHTSNAAVLSISDALVLEARAPGTATLTATSEGKTATAVFTVVPVPVASVTVTPVTTEIEVGETVQLTAVARDSAGGVLTGRAATWSSTSHVVLAVNGTGLVTGVGGGESLIIATVEGRAGSAEVKVRELPTPNRVSAGTTHTCGLAPDGQALCWGQRNYGQLGDGVRFNLPFVDRPQVVPGGLTFSSLSAGNGHTCAVTGGGVAWCWGRNHWGQLGTGGTVSASVPTAVNTTRRFTSISVFETFTCALEVGGAMWCWGDNRMGQLGDGSLSQRLTPVPVSGGLLFTAMDVGGSRACGVTAGGAAYCWGSNVYDALGTGQTSAQLEHSAVPVRVTGSVAYRAVSVGERHTCGLAADGRAYCWGLNSDARLGYGINYGMYASPVAVSGDRAYAQISAGGTHTCAVTTGGTAYCWGDNGYGQVGDGSQATRMVPSEVAGGLLGPTGVSSISTGSTHSCLVTAAGRGYCWGSNALGVGGTGTSDANFTPTPLAPSIRVTQ